MRCSGTAGQTAIASAFIALGLMVPLPVFAQDVTEPALKAAFIYSFVRFTEWPEALPISDPFVMCVPGDAAVGDALDRAVKGRQFGGHRIVVSQMASDEQKQACHVLYLSGVIPSRAGKLLAALGDAPVLTISDMDGFTTIGGMVQFFYEDGRLRFGIRLQSAQRVRLRISSKLVVLAKRYD